jgi:hypothetical protein
MAPPKTRGDCPIVGCAVASTHEGDRPLFHVAGKVVPVTVSGTMTDDLSCVDTSSATFQVVDEYGLVQPSGSVAVGTDGTFTFSVGLVASRNGNDTRGRHYTISISASDNAGNLGSSPPLVVLVPHDQDK